MKKTNFRKMYLFTYLYNSQIISQLSTIVYKKISNKLKKNRWINSKFIWLVAMNKADQKNYFGKKHPNRVTKVTLCLINWKKLNSNLKVKKKMKQNHKYLKNLIF